jgi:hypothetical protein
MPDIRNTYAIGAPVPPAHRAEIIKDRRRPDRSHNIRPAPVPLLRNPTAGPTAGLPAGALVAAVKFQFAATWAASAHPTDIWLRMSTTERSTAIYRELRNLGVANAARARRDSQI